MKKCLNSKKTSNKSFLEANSNSNNMTPVVRIHNTVKSNNKVTRVLGSITKLIHLVAFFPLIRIERTEMLVTQA